MRTQRLIISLILLQTLLYSQDSFEIGGQIVTESAWFTNEEGASTNDQALRRARISIKGEALPDLKYEVEYSFTGSNDWKDVYLEYQFLPDFFMKVGNMKEPIGLEALSSSKYNTFMERSLTQAFINKRKLGVQMKYHYEKNSHDYTLTAGVFRESLDELIEGEEAENSFVARATYAYTPSKKHLLHLGVSTAYTTYDQQKISLGTLPESDLFDRKLVSTKIKNVEETNRLGFESAIVWDEFSLQGEYLYMGVDNIDMHYHFKSWYLQGSWFITGESRRYKAQNGTFSRIKPLSPVTKGGYGAWEVAFRVSYLDIDDKDEEESRETDYTLGVNWYATSHVRVMANYIHAQLSEPNLTEEDIFQMRIQYDF